METTTRADALHGKTIDVSCNREWLKLFIETIAKNHCVSIGVGFLTWERVGAEGSAVPVRYMAVAHDGRRIELPTTSTARIETACKWVMTGEGEMPTVLPADTTGGPGPNTSQLG